MTNVISKSTHTKLPLETQTLTGVSQPLSEEYLVTWLQLYHL